MFEFLAKALTAGIGVAIIAGPFGSLIVWRRLAYFGDTLAHSALLGVALGFLLDTAPLIGVLAGGQVLAILLFLLQRNKNLSSDTLLGILSHGSLAVGLIVVSMMEKVRIDLLAYLFGDVLSVDNSDILLIYGGGTIALALLAWLWLPLLSISVDEDLAQVEGVPVERVKLTFFCLVAFVVAIMMKIVGLILVTALFIIPAATARKFATSPEGMAIGASACAAISVFLGLAGSWHLDTPAGPSIVVAALVLFVGSAVGRQ